MRNVVAHVYWEADHDIVWQVIMEEVPRLHAQVEALLQEIENQRP